MRGIKLNTIVKVKSDLEGRNRYGNLYFPSQMEEYRGNEYKIIDRKYYSELDTKVGYKLEGTDRAFIFSLEMFEEVSEDNMEELEKCHDCGTLVSEGELVYLEHLDIYVCQECIDNDYIECHDCGLLYREVDIRETAYGYCVCQDCRDRDYSYCDDCDRLFYSDDIHYNEYNDAWYCDNCYCNHEVDGRIYGYHEFCDWIKYVASGEVKPPFYIGHELEVENNNDDTSCIDLLYDNLNVILAHDGSLNNGYEIISHPQSYKYILEHKNKYEEVFNTMIRNGYKSHETSTCGLHFHVTRPFYDEINSISPWNASEEDMKKRNDLINKQNEVIDRIILVMETYKEEIIKFSRRKPSEMHWCQFLSDFKNKPSGEIKSLYYVKKNKDTNTRYMALNLENSATIEFRIFKGTLKFDTFMASVELVNNIMTLCSNLELPVTDITWDKLIDSEYAREYCNEKGIHTDKVVVDNSKEEIDLEEKMRKALKKTYKDLVRIYNAEVKRITSGFKLQLKDSIGDMRTKLANNYRKLNELDDLTTSLSDLLARFNNEEFDMCAMKNKIRQFIDSNNYATRAIKWELYEDIKNKLLEIVNN